MPSGVDNPEVYRQRSGEMVLPRSQTWFDAYLDKREVWQPVTVPVPAA